MSPYRAIHAREPEPELPVTVDLEFDPPVEGAMWVVPVLADRDAVTSDVWGETAGLCALVGGGFLAAVVCAVAILGSG